MGCCHSSPEDRVPNMNSNNTVPAASIVVTKAPSHTFENTAEPSHANSPPPSIGDDPPTTTVVVEPEKKRLPVMIEDQTSINKPDIPITQQEVPTSAPQPQPQPTQTMELEEGPWYVIIRLSNTHQDIHVPIPTQPPYMTITQLKQHIDLEPHQQLKLIHLGHILKDASVLMPRAANVHASDGSVYVSNQGVIQAMMYSI